MNSLLQLGPNYYAEVRCEAVAITQLLQLAQLIAPNAAPQYHNRPVCLLAQPVVHRTADGQYEVLNAPQVLAATDHYHVHPESNIQILLLLNESDLPVARLYYQSIEIARQFGQAKGLVTAARANDHRTLLLSRHILSPSSDAPATIDQIAQLCGGSVGKSTINKVIKDLGFNNPNLGCKAPTAKTNNNEQKRPQCGEQNR